AEAIAQAKEMRKPLSGQQGARPTPAPAEIRATGVEGVAECLPTEFERGEPGLSFARDALDCGLDVVFADKGPLVCELPDLEERGIADLNPKLIEEASERGGRLRLIGRVERERRRIRIAVAPEITFPGDSFYDCEGANKAVRFSSIDLGDVTLIGGASSLRGTASALLRDLIAAARERA